MRIAVRVDASPQIGTGHFMRCLTLANGLRQRGAEVSFICRDLPGHLAALLEDAGVSMFPLACGNEAAHESGLAHAHWLKASLAEDAEGTLDTLSGQSWDWLVVDHYALDVRWERAMRRMAQHIMVIDDLADREHDCDLLLDQNLYADMRSRYSGKVPAHCRLLLGPSFALLRDEFRDIRKLFPRSGRVKRVLIFFGGMDATNQTGVALQALAECGCQDIAVDVVIGAGHPYRERILTDCKQQGFFCHVQTSRMAELMAEADLAIGAGGVATWERCCLGLPTLALITADNQRQQMEDAAKAGLVYVPEIQMGDVSALARHLQALLENDGLRECMSRNGMDSVKGAGVAQVALAMGATDIEIRPARVEDSVSLFQWRNHPAVRAVSRNTAEISWEDHEAWFVAVLGNSKRKLLLGYKAGEPVGVVRFDMADNEAEISIYLVAEMMSRGMGGPLLASAELWLLKHVPEIQKIRAHVLGGNLRSQKLFCNAGYQPESVYYLKELH